MTRFRFAVASILFAGIFAGCNPQDRITPFEHDGCEYIILDDGFKQQSMIHKGNCKSCVARDDFRALVIREGK